MRRINEAPDLFNMVYTLVDGIFFRERDGRWTADYCEGMPFEYINKEHGDLHRMVVMFGFDGQRRTLDKTIEEGIGFEPFLWYWEPTPSKGKVHKEVLRLNELAHIDWSIGVYQALWNAWGSDIIAKITNSQNESMKIQPGEPGHADRLGSPYDMKVMELDMVVINDLGVDVELARQKHADRTRTDGDHGPSEFMMRSSTNMHDGRESTHDVAISSGGTAQKVVTRDGEIWKAKYTDPDTRQQTSITIEVDFRWGIFQEVWLSELRTAATKAQHGSTDLLKQATITRYGCYNYFELICLVCK